jgi:hypothetical protein
MRANDLAAAILTEMAPATKPELTACFAEGEFQGFRSALQRVIANTDLGREFNQWQEARPL